MAQFKNLQMLTISTSAAFDALHKPGDICPNSGIYRCENCGDEIAANKGTPLPPQNHHQHALGKGPIQWRLIVFAQQR